MKFIGIIPARYASTRFPGKPLADIRGKPMIRHVYEHVQQSGIASLTVIATDDPRIGDAASLSGARVIMTSPLHGSGTERCGEAAQILLNKGEINPEDVVINIQGDEPFVHPSQLRLLSSCFKNENPGIATLLFPITRVQDLLNPNKVKAVLDNDGFILYFSRSPIPYLRDVPQEEWTNRNRYYKHIGIYAYTAKILFDLVKLPPATLEKAESLEQLRWMEHGYRIQARVSDHENLAVDTPEDLQKLIKSL